jgi:DNA mismatch endonuclease (patch repair protein)
MPHRALAKPHQWPNASAQVRARMARVRLKGTEPEQRLCRFLVGHGIEFTVNDSSLPGSPDIVFADHKVAIFVHGCFWHGHAGCGRAKIPQNNHDLWLAKIKATVRRDRRVCRVLRKAGWSVLTFWECQRDEEDMRRFLQRLLLKMQFHARFGHVDRRLHQ